MPTFTIYSPALAGLAQNQPSIKVSSIFSTDNSNVRIEDGEILRSNLRLPEIVDSNGDLFTFPRYIFDMIDPIMNPSENPSFVDDESLDDIFSLAGDQTEFISAGDTIRITDSVSNNGIYNVDFVLFNSDNITFIYVAEDIPVPTDFTGELWAGEADVVHQHTLTDDQQDEFLFLFTEFNIFRWDFSAKTLTVVWTVVGSGTLENWSTESVGNKVLATNNVDIPLIGTSISLFTGIDTNNGPEVSTGVFISKAKLVKSFENYTLLGNVTLSDGTRLPSTFYNSDLNNEEEWDQGDAAFFDIEGNDHLTGWGREFEKLIIFKERSIHEMFFVATSDLFSINKFSSVIGCIAPHSIINDANGKLYYLATDKTIKNLQDGEISQKISSTILDLQDTLVPKVRGTFIDEFSELWWALPIGGDATNNNKVITYDNTRLWNFIDIDISSFGKYSRVETQTWNNIAFENWNAWDQTWNSIKQNAGFPIDLVSDFDGRVYAAHESSLDRGVEYTGFFVLTTDLSSKQSLPINKRLLNSEWYFRNGNTTTSTVTISIKGSNESSYTVVGTLNIFDSDNPEFSIIPLSLDIKQKSFDIKISGTNSFQFIGCVLDYETLSNR